jgi:hypothetical protein
MSETKGYKAARGALPFDGVPSEVQIRRLRDGDPLANMHEQELEQFQAIARAAAAATDPQEKSAIIAAYIAFVQRVFLDLIAETQRLGEQLQGGDEHATG